MKMMKKMFNEPQTLSLRNDSSQKIYAIDANREVDSNYGMMNKVDTVPLIVTYESAT